LETQHDEIPGIEFRKKTSTTAGSSPWMSVDGSVPLWKEHSTQTERERYPLVNVYIAKITIFSWENSLFLWPFPIAMLNYQRVNDTTNKSKGRWI